VVPAPAIERFRQGSGHAEHCDLALRVEQDVGHRDALVVPDVHVAGRAELAAVAGREPQYLVDP
jgi:hypothetical protein